MEKALGLLHRNTFFFPFNSLYILPLCPVMHCFWRWAVTDIPSGFCRGKIGVS